MSLFSIRKDFHFRLPHIYSLNLMGFFSELPFRTIYQKFRSVERLLNEAEVVRKSSQTQQNPEEKNPNDFGIHKIFTNVGR